MQDGIDVFAVSRDFADIYQKLDGVKWGGKSVGIAIESLEKLNKSAHIAATDERIVFVWRDDIQGNWTRPAPGDWNGYGEITTAIVLKLRQVMPELQSASESKLYSAVVNALVRGLDENGRYIYSKRAEIMEDGRILTSSGLEGIRDERGNWRVQSVVMNSPADNAGIAGGDLITEINGKLVKNMSDGDLATAFAGFNSGTLKLGLVSGQGSRVIILRRASVIIADADIVYRNSDYGNREAILEVIIHKISDNSVQLVNEALGKYKDAMGIMLDLRSATGDDERSAAKLAGLFLGREPVMRIVETERSEIEIVPGGDAITGLPIVAAVSSGTSGTAEALAAAIYETGRGVLIGTPTSGRARLATKLDLENGGALELYNRVAKTGRGRELDGRGVFPLICLSNIRNSEQQGAFFLNVINGDFNAMDLNADAALDVAAARRGCPNIRSGEDEDVLAEAVAFQILSDKKIYDRLK